MIIVYFVYVLGTSNCAGLNCEYACNNDSDARPVCICKTGYELKDSENCTGNILNDLTFFTLSRLNFCHY